MNEPLAHGPFIAILAMAAATYFARISGYWLMGHIPLTRRVRRCLEVLPGAIMAATVLNSERAIEMSVFVVRAFVRMREMLAKNRLLAAKIDELDRRLETHDASIQDIIEAIKELMVPEGPSKRKIGFQLPPGKA